MLQPWTHGCTLSNNMRQANQNIVHPQCIRSMLPISSVSNHGAIHSGHTICNAALLPLEPVQRVTDEIRLAIDAKAQAEMQPQQF